MFERTLQDLIRGLRAHKASSKAQEDAFLAEAMNEIRTELRGKDMVLKTEGVLKMCYLMMLYPIPPPTGFAFHVVEVMSSARYHLKQLGYMAAPLAFSGDTEEVVLTVNGIKKDLLSPHTPIPPLPLTALPHLLALSPSLSSTIHPDLLHLLTHSSARIRKRAMLCLLPCWDAYPEGLRDGFPRLRERLLDDDQGVVGATVSVVMELARRQGGQRYLPLAPELFGILTASSNNWMLIKVVKLFAILTPLEPRLVRKLLPPLTSLISSTSAISLLYECVRTCIVGGMLDPDRAEGEALARVCVEKLGGYLRDEGGDQNLRYISLLAMVKIIPTHPDMVAEYQEEVLESLEDPDVSIRMRALELVTSMVNRDNLQYIVDQLLSHLAPPEQGDALPSALSSLAAASGQPSTDPSTTAQSISSSPAYRLLLAQRLFAIIGHDTYVNVSDFEWAVSVLIDVALVSHVNVGTQVKEMLLDVVGRVKSVRPHAVAVLEKVIGDEEVRERARDKSGEDGLLEAAVWICSEYSENLSSPLSAISSLLSPSLNLATPQLISLSLHATAKVFGNYAADVSSRWSADLHEETKNLVASIRDGLSLFLASAEIEIQERAFELSQLFGFVDADLQKHTPPARAVRGDAEDIPGVHGGFEDAAGSSAEPVYPKSLFLFQPLFTSHELNTVAHRAQELVSVPDTLDLGKDIVPGGGLGGLTVDDEDSEAEKAEMDLGEGGGAGMEELRRVLREQEKGRKGKKGKGKGKKVDGEVAGVDPAERARRKAANRELHKDDPYYLVDKDDEDVDDIPIVRLDDADLAGPELSDSKPVARKAVGTKKKARVKTVASAPPADFDRAGEIPEGAVAQPAPVRVDAVRKGLEKVDLDAGSGSGEGSRPVSRGTGRYEEYTLDEEKNGVGNGHAEKRESEVSTVSTGQGTTGTETVSVPDSTATTPSAVDTPVAQVEVVKVRRKKDGEKKKKKKTVVAE